MQTLGRRVRKAEDSAEVTRAFCEQLSKLTILYGQHVEGTIPAGGTYVPIRHSLGRSYVGGIIVAASIGAPLVVQDPVTASQMGLDVVQFVVVLVAGIAPDDIDVTVWVY